MCIIMYFVRTPNQILKACYSLAILTVVVSCFQQVAADTQRTEEASSSGALGPAIGSRPIGADEERAPTNNNYHHYHNHNINNSINNFNNNNNNIKLLINPNAGAKSLEEQENARNDKNEEETTLTTPTIDKKKQKQKQRSSDFKNNNSNGDSLNAKKNTKKKDTTKDGTTTTTQLHKLMSEKDLRRTFQVDTHDQVPEYQVLKLTVSQDGSHLISPISDLGELLITTATNDHNHHHHRHHHHHHSEHQHQNQHHHQQQQSLNDKKSEPAGSYLTREQRQPGDDQDEHNARTSAEAHQHRYEDRQRQPGQEDWAATTKTTTTSSSNSTTTSGRVKRSANEERRQQQGDAANLDDRLIVMNLSTFGQNFSLRLKRNADFQQRIKDMKMFLAESMSDGQLRYTEIKNPNFHQHHKQEPHKRAASNDAVELADLLEDSHMRQQATDAKTAAAANCNSCGSSSTATPQEQGQKQADPAKSAPRPSDDKHGQSDKKHDWNIGSTYHDEENLAALLIERDRLTGQIKVDGTIGNDFVIKPMPRDTIEALLAKQRLAEAALELTRKPVAESKATDSETSSSSGGSARKGSNGGEPGSASELAASSANELRQAAGHMHDDDPHDDDEMFLDEDEALELASLDQTASASRAATNSTAQAASLPQQQAPLSKAASERKWRKYRKLVAQTQVPKLGGAGQQAQYQEKRARRHTGSNVNTREASSSTATTTNSSPQHFRMSHHIVYRQRPSSEASSSEHKHSFMLAPGQQTMEEMARLFPGKQLNKRSTGDNMIDGAAASRLSRDSLGLPEADYAHDPMGGQFYLEPGSVTGFDRAGYADWALVSGARRHALAAPPPYAFNSSAVDEEAGFDSGVRMDLQRRAQDNDDGSAAAANGTHARHKRHLGSVRPRGSRLPAASSHRAHAHARGGGDASASASASNRRHKRQAPDVVWPEVLLVVDYDSFLLHGGDSREVKRYFVSFWNGVDLRYKLLVNPHIRISLAGMIVAKDRDATPYLERNRLRAPNADAVDAAGALTDMGKYLYREDRLPTYDLAVVITKLDMCRRRYEGGRCNRGTAGFAYVGGACVVNKRLEKVNSVAIIEDSGGFSGIIVAAHEVGHLLGCVHDGSPPPSYLGGPGATHCPWEDGFIMSDLRHTERGFRWSQCSVEQFKHFLNGETATCLYNYPHESQMLHRLLPGSMLSLDDQCKRDRGTNACFKDARVCAQLFCFDSASGYCVSYRPAAEGSPCGDGHVCRNGKCVGEIENIIPDYTHQSQTVVAATGGGRQRSLVPAGSSAATATAVVSSALVPSPSSRLADNGLSASSTSTATSSPDGEATSGKLPATGGGPSTVSQQTGGQISSRRMDTIQVDTPLNLARTGHLYQPPAQNHGASDEHIDIRQSLPINYHHQHQQHHHHHHQQQQQQQQQHHKNNNNNNHHQEQQAGVRQLHQLQAAAYADPYGYTSQRKREPTATTGLTRSNELYAASSSMSPRSSSPQSGTARSTRRAQKQQTDASATSLAAPTYQQRSRTTATSSLALA